MFDTLANPGQKHEQRGAPHEGHLTFLGYYLSAFGDFKYMVDQIMDGGEPLLYTAAKKGYVTLVEKLLVARAAIDHISSKGLTALNIASKNNHADVVAKLIVARAVVNSATQTAVVEKLIMARAAINQAA